MAAASSEPAAEVVTLSIYKAARRIKLRESTLYNALRGVAHDAAFVAKIAVLPLVANLRCGLWYAPPRALTATCYFKSTDGHAGNWGERRLHNS